VTGFAHKPDDVKDLIKMVNGAPLVIKLLEGTQGIGVVLAETEKAAESVIEAFMGLHANILVQEFIKEAGGTDIRCLVIDGKVVASLERKGAKGDFRSNLHRGGTASLIKITSQERAAAVGAAKAMGLNVCGVDMLRANHGPVVMEVNSSPGLQGIEDATQLDIAGAIVDDLGAQIAFPELDVRQRLTVSRGYDVADLNIPAGSEFVGRTLADSGLAEKDINVLSLHRDGKVIPNPKASRELLAGDRLLCFGKVSAMRELIPEPSRRRRKPKLKPLPSHPPSS